MSDDIAWTGSWTRRGGILVPVGPRPVDTPPSAIGKRQLEPIKHGTDGGYHVHKKRKEAACAACKAAHTQRWRERRDKRLGRVQIMTRQERLAKGVAA